MEPYIVLDNYFSVDDSILRDALAFYRQPKFQDFRLVSPGKMVDAYAFDEVIENNKELVEYKQEYLQPIADQFLVKFNLHDIKNRCFFFVVQENKHAGWHIDAGKVATSPTGTVIDQKSLITAAMNYSFNDEKRASVKWRDSDKNVIAELKSYKCAMLDVLTEHMVDSENQNFPERANFKISFYEVPFQEIKKRIEKIIKGDV